jgi:transcriptional regulator with XRE-family HTH domain
LSKLYNDCKRKSISEFAVILGKFTAIIRTFAEWIGNFAYLIGKYAYRKDVYIMYRCRLEELRKEKGLSNKKWSEESGVSVDTIDRIIHPENPEKDSPRVNTLEDLCEVLGVELWEIFYLGDRSFVALQAEIAVLKSERDALVAENAVLETTVGKLRDKVDNLKDEIIDTHKYYNKLKPNS